MNKFFELFRNLKKIGLGSINIYNSINNKWVIEIDNYTCENGETDPEKYIDIIEVAEEEELIKTLEEILYRVKRGKSKLSE